MEKDNLWKVAVVIYLLCYLSSSLIIFIITNRGSLGIIIVIGMIIILPYIIYNLFKKNPVKVPEEVPNEPDIENLY